MVVESRLSDISEEDKKDIRTTLQKYELPTTLTDLYMPESILEKMRTDKKNQAGHIKLTLLDSIGVALINQERDEEQIVKALRSITS